MSIPALADVAVGRPITRDGVSVVPVHLPGAVDVPVDPTNDHVVVTEADDATVPTITIANPGARPVLFVEGETVRGGQQDRSFNVSVLVPAGAEIACPVSCVEQGRWGGERRFRTDKHYATRRVRRAKSHSVAANLDHTDAKRSDQGLVWSVVDAELSAHRLAAPTAAMRDLERRFADEPRLRDAADELVARGPLPGQRGVVIAHGGRIVAADVFATPELLVAHWPALVRGYLLDAPTDVSGRPSLDRAVRFLHRFATADARRAAGVGLGTEHHVTHHTVVGQALVWDGALVHASAFALAA